MSLAYIAAAEGTLDDPLPTRMGLRVDPTWSSLSSNNDRNALVDFDGLEKVQVRYILEHHVDKALIHLTDAHCHRLPYQPPTARSSLSSSCSAFLLTYRRIDRRNQEALGTTWQTRTSEAPAEGYGQEYP